MRLLAEAFDSHVLNAHTLKQAQQLRCARRVVIHGAQPWRSPGSTGDTAQALSRAHGSHAESAASDSVAGPPEGRLPALGGADQMVLAEEAPRSHGRAKHELSALEAGHHGFRARRRDDRPWRLFDVAQTILGELGGRHAVILPGCN